MKYSIVSIAFAASAVAQSLGGIPSCATNCVTQYTSGDQIAGCAQLDIACICKNSDFLSGIACCLASACDATGQQQAVTYAKQICTSAGVTVPDKVVCDKAASSGSASASSSSPASSAASSAAASSTTKSGSASTPTTGSATGSPSGSATGSPTASGSGSASGATTASAAGASGSASAAATTSKNAAPMASAGSLVGAAALAMLAAL